MENNKYSCCYFYKCLFPKVKNNLFIVFEDWYDSINSKKTSIIGFEDIFSYLKNSYFLNDMYKYANTIKFKDSYLKSINRIAFISYVVNNKITIPAMEENYIINNVNNSDTNKIIFDNNGKNLNILFKNDLLNNDNELINKKLFNVKEISIKEKLKEQFSIEENNSYIFSVHKLYYQDTEEFVIAFLNWIFSTEETIYVKQCEKCNGFFITKNNSSKMCHREIIIDNKIKSSCASFKKDFTKTKKFKNFRNEDKKFLQKIANKMASKYDEKLEEYQNNYIRTRDKLIDEAKETNNIDLLTDFVSNYINEHPFNF